MKTYVEINKRSKKEQKAYYAQSRVMNGFNTGTRTMKTEKNPSRQESKNKLKKMLDKGEY